MAVLQDININVFAQPSEKRLRSFLVLSQNENGRTINFRILGSPLPSSCTATLSGTKPDGNVYSTSGIVAGNFVIVQEDIQMTAVAGVWDAKLDIVNGSHNIMTAIIRITVEGDVVAPGSVPSNSQLDGYIAQAKFYAEESRVEAYGSPLTAATKSAMIDKNRVYVYTGSESNMTAGNWYYWNGTAWVSGGVYNSAAVDTDTTLTLPDKAADAKAVGDAFSNLNENLKHNTLLEYESTITASWESGVINNNTGAEGITTDYIRTTRYYRCLQGLEITVANGYKARVAIYTSQGGAAGFLGWLDSSDWTGTKYYQSPNGTLFRIRLCKDPISTIDPSEGANVTIKSYGTDQTLSKQYASADAKATGDALEKRLNIVDVTAISANDDLNDYTTPGRYYSGSTAVTASLSNCPITDTGFELIVRKVSSSAYYEQILTVNGVVSNEQYHRVKTSVWSQWFKNLDFEDIMNPRISSPVINALATMPQAFRKTIKVATYNVMHYGVFSSRINGLYSNPVMVDNYRKFLMNNGIDLLFLQECEDTIDTDGSKSAFDYLYKYFFVADHNIDTDTDDRYTSAGRRKVLTRLPFTSPSTELTSVVKPYTYHEYWNGYYSWCICALPNVGDFLIINVHNFAHDNSEQVTNRKLLLDDIETLIGNQSDNFDYFIIAGDFNTNTADDYANLQSFCSDINGTPANGGVFGWFYTSVGSDRVTNHCHDNVIVSNNIRIDRVECNPLYAKELFSDHMPVVVTLTLPTGESGSGNDGTTFTPSVSSAGVISWTNDGNKQNPSSVDLVAAIPTATTEAAGKMSATDKGRLDTLYADYSSALTALGVS